MDLKIRKHLISCTCLSSTWQVVFGLCGLEMIIFVARLFVAVVFMYY